MDAKAVTALELFYLVNQEFARLRPETCYRCITPVPVFRSATESNWALPLPSECDEGCAGILAAIQQRFEPEYRLQLWSDSPSKLEG